MADPQDVKATAELVNAFNVTGRGWMLGIVLNSGAISAGDVVEVPGEHSPLTA